LNFIQSLDGCSVFYSTTAEKFDGRSSSRFEFDEESMFLRCLLRQSK